MIGFSVYRKVKH